MDRSVRFRLTPRQQRLHVLPLAVACVAVTGLQARIFGVVGLAVAAVATAVAVGSALVMVRWSGVELTPEAVIVRRNTTRAHPWSQVTGVRSRRRGSARTLVLDIDGREVRCPAPSTGLLLADRDFEDKLAYIEQWWRWCRARDGLVDGGRPPRSDVGWGQRVVAPTRPAR